MLAEQIVNTSKNSYTFRLKPYKHQLEGLKRAIKHRAYGLFFEQGTGKSKVAVDYAGYLAQHGEVKAVLIVCPLSVVGVWAGADGQGGEIRKNFPTGAKRRIINLAGLGSAKIKETLPKAKHIEGVTDFYVINYDSVWRVLPELRKHFLANYSGTEGQTYTPRGYTRDRPLLRVYSPSLDLAVTQVEVTEGTCPLLVVADESFLIKGRTTNRSRALHQLARLTPYRLALTGTPIGNSPTDAWSQFRFINPKVFGLNFRAFEQQYVIKGGYGQYKIFGHRNLDDFQRRLHSQAQVVKKEDALDLPEKMYQTIPVELTPKTRRAYDKMSKEMIADIEEYVEEAKAQGVPFRAMASIVLTKMLRLSQLTSGFITDTEGTVRRVSTEKLTTAIDLISNLIEEGEKVVVFCRFLQELDDLALELGRKAIKYRTIQGKVSGLDRTRFIREFQNDPTPMVMLCQVASGSMGITLTAAHTAIYYNLDFSVTNYLQSQDRLHRIGQEHKVTYLHLTVPRSIDVEVYKALQQKQNIANLCLKAPGGVRGFLQAAS